MLYGKHCFLLPCNPWLCRCPAAGALTYEPHRPVRSCVQCSAAGGSSAHQQHMPPPSPPALLLQQGDAAAVELSAVPAKGGAKGSYNSQAVVEQVGHGPAWVGRLLKNDTKKTPRPDSVFLTAVCEQCCQSTAPAWYHLTIPCEAAQGCRSTTHL